MKLLQSRKFSCASVLLFSVVLAAPQSIMSQSHVVSPGDIQNDVSNASSARQQNQKQVENFLSSRGAERAMKSAKIDPRQVTNAVSQLSDAQLASLAARSAKAQKEFAAGTIDNHDLLLILVALAALILIIVAVH